MSTVVVTGIARGLPDGSGFVPYRVTATPAGKPLGHEGLVGDQWLPWQVLIDSVASCACGGCGYRGPDVDWETGELSKRGSMDPCPYCPNGETRRRHRNTQGRR